MSTTTRTTLILVALTLGVLGAQTPNPPTTGANSVQLLAGGTDLAWITVFPPTTYADGTAIPEGRGVTINIYRSSSGGESYTSRVQKVAGGSGFVGQGAAGSRTKPWIDIKISVGVDNKEPYLVYLAASAVVDGEESLATTAFLTFRYYPSLLAFATPGDATGGDTPDGPPTRGLAGTWSLPDGVTMVIKQNGNRFTGTIKTRVALTNLAGTVRGRTYAYTMTTVVQGETLRMTGTMTLSEDGRSVVMTTTYLGQTESDTYRVEGRTMSRM